MQENKPSILNHKFVNRNDHSCNTRTMNEKEFNELYNKNFSNSFFCFFYEQSRAFYRIVIFMILIVLVVMCETKNNKHKQQTLKQAFKIVINDSNKNLIYRYYDKNSTTFKTAKKISDIPVKYRNIVTVFDTGLPINSIAPDENIIADLTKPDKHKNYPYRIVKTVKIEAQFIPTVHNNQKEQLVVNKSGKKTSFGAGIIIFGTQGCPHCRDAKQFFKTHKIPFKWIDVERNSQGVQLLQQLGKEQKIPQQYLNSVPIIYINNKLIIGFDRAQVEKQLQLIK